MKPPKAILACFSVCAVLAVAGAAAAWAQDPAPVTRVVPIAPAPAATPASAPVSPPANASIFRNSPAMNPGRVSLSTVLAPIYTTGTTPIVSGSAPLVSGTATIPPLASGTAAIPSPTPSSPYSIEIDLGAQRAYLLKNGKKLVESPISSGRVGHLTPTGDFSVIQKDLNHVSTLYGKIVDGSGRLVKAGADSAMPVPKGCKFIPAPMKWFLRFDGAAGMHAGILPGYAASHGCVRMPPSKAELFYQTVDIGTPVHVFGTAPIHESEPDIPAPHHPTALAKPKLTPKPWSPPYRHPALAQIQPHAGHP